jgi:hypothetical protein
MRDVAVPPAPGAQSLAPPPIAPTVARSDEPTELAPASSRGRVLALWCGVALYLGLRVLALVMAPELESDDSTGYLINAAIVRAYGVSGGHGLTPDFTPFYPVAIILAGLTKIDLVVAGRIVSLAFSLVLLGSVIGIGRRIASPKAVVAAVFLMAVSPMLVTLSVSVLSEPSYVGTIYLGLWLFLRQVREPRVAWGALLGLIFGLAFLNRIEGLLFLGAIPLLQLIERLVTGRRDRRSLGAVARWSAAYVLVFLVAVAPHVVWVSKQMGSFAINGRQAWSLLDSKFDGGDREKLLYGLDYSPKLENLAYMWGHPEERAKLVARTSPVVYVKLAARNVDVIYRDHLGELVGPGVVAFALLGLVALARRKLVFPLVLIAGFVVTALVPPLLQTHILLRHLAVLAPILLLLAGEGIVALVTLTVPRRAPLANRALPAVLTALMVAVSVVPLRDAIGAPVNPEYDPASLAEPARIVREAQRELNRQVVLCDRSGYLGQLTGARPIVIPHTDLQGFVKYLALNRADLLFINYQHLGTRPFAADFSRATPPPGFTLLYRGMSAAGYRVELYRLNLAAQ